MKRMLPRLLAVIAICLLSTPSLRAAPVQTVVHAATSSTPFIIAVLSDHYTDQGEFNLDVDNFIQYGLLAHPYYASRAADLHIVSVYDALKTGASNYDFNVEVPSADCVISWSESDTAWKVEQAVAGVNAEHTIVIGNHPYDLGCTSGEWSYVALDAASTDVLAHELGHGIARVLDEWFPVERAGVSHPGIPLADTRNCYDTRHGAAPPAPGFAPWNTLNDLSFQQGCGLYELNVKHGYELCLMGNRNHTPFCKVCLYHMAAAFDYIRNPESDNPDAPGAQTPNAPSNLRIVPAAYVMQPPAKSPPKAPGTTGPTGTVLPPTTARPAQPIVRLVVSFNPENGAIVPKKAFPTTGRYLPEYRRHGEYVYEILDNDQTIAVGVISSQSYEARSYGGGTHQTSKPRTTDLTIPMPIPGEWLRDGKHNVSIRVWWLLPGVTEPRITPAVLAKLKLDKRVEQRGATVTAKDIAGVL